MKRNMLLNALLVILALSLLLCHQAEARRKGTVYISAYGGNAEYSKEGDAVVADSFAGGMAGYLINKYFGAELRVEYMDIGASEFIMPEIGAALFLTKVDFFMVPYIGVHGGALLPSGEKSDIDGILSLDIGARFINNYGMFIGPRGGAHLVFEGPKKSLITRTLIEVGVKF